MWYIQHKILTNMYKGCPVSDEEIEHAGPLKAKKVTLPLLPMSKIDHGPVQANLYPRFNVLYLLARGKSNKANTLVYLRSCLIFVGDIEYNSLLLWV